MKSALDKILRSIRRTPKSCTNEESCIFVRHRRTIDGFSADLDSIGALRPNDKAIEKAKADLLTYRLGFYQKAFPDFKAAAELTKTDSDYWYWYGNTAMLSEKMDDARTAYSECVEVKPDNQDCWCSSGCRLCQTKDAEGIGGGQPSSALRNSPRRNENAERSGNPLLFLYNRLRYIILCAAMTKEPSRLIEVCLFTLLRKPLTYRACH